MMSTATAMDMGIERKQQKCYWRAHVALEEARKAMEEAAAKMLFLKREGRSKSPELRELITNMSLLFISLRHVNRAILLEEDHVRSETESAKAPVDLTTLQLHNLMYEKNHYLKAIKACKDFKSKYPNIVLVPKEEFFSDAPEDIKGKILFSGPAHDLILKRLNFELFQRKELCKLHDKLEQHKKGLVEMIANRKNFLTSIPLHLKSLKKASLPVQQQLRILHTKKLKQHRAAELLLPPLYIVYSQLLALKEAFGEKIEMEILGSTKDAQVFCQHQANDNGTSTTIENIRLEDDLPVDEEDTQRRRKRSKKCVSKDNVDQAGIYQSHPLRIILYIYDDEDEGTKASKILTLRFEYLVKLHVVCVGLEGVAEGFDDDILCNLFPDDTGMDLPHQIAKLLSGDWMVISERKTLRPYRWAQHLAGMDILAELPPSYMSNITSNGGSKEAEIYSGLSVYGQQNRAQTILQRIRHRKKAQIALAEQLDSLTKLKWPSLIYRNVPWASHTPLCTLRNWSREENVSDSNSGIVGEQIANSVKLDMERRSVTSWEVESAREDGELLVGQPSSVPPEDSKIATPDDATAHEQSRTLAMLSKSVTPPKKLKFQYSFREEDNPELTLDSDSDVEEHDKADVETENVGLLDDKAWKDQALREYNLTLSRINQQGQLVKLEAKVKISMEYPLRPPLYMLRISIAGITDCFEWHNELRAMEAEVNLHIVKMIPATYESDVFAHQVCCLAMIFDFQFDMLAKRRSTSVFDIGLCKPVKGTILVRSFRGRDRRKIISWKGMC